MRQTLQVLPTDEIRLDDDWGFPSGIIVDGVRITLIGPKVIGKMMACLQDLQREQDDRDAREDGRPTEAESAVHGTIAGFNNGCRCDACRYMDEDAVRDRMIEDRAMEDRAEAGI